MAPQLGKRIEITMANERMKIHFTVAPFYPQIRKRVECVLKASPQPMGVAEYTLTRSLPKDLKASLPTP